MRASSLVGMTLVTTDGRSLGTIAEVLFHPAEPRVIGFAVQPPRLAGLVKRSDRYIPLGACALSQDSALCTARRLPSRATSERAVGLSWDEAVQWRGMPVAVASGAIVGSVSDVAFDERTGAVESLQVSSGLLGDAAVGKLSAPPAAVVGYLDGAVRLSCEFADLLAEGGAARAAAAGAALLKEAGVAVAKRAYDTGMSAAIGVARSMRRGAGRRMLDAVKRAVSEATREDE